MMRDRGVLLSLSSNGRCAVPVAKVLLNNAGLSLCWRGAVKMMYVMSPIAAAEAVTAAAAAASAAVAATPTSTPTAAGVPLYLASLIRTHFSLTQHLSGRTCILMG
jgi:hypothetical protein